MKPTVYNAESMIQTIRRMGIIPFFHGSIPGYSIEEMTDPDCWFTTSDNLGPWDWKINAVQEGDIAYGKFLGGKAAFATVELYAHLMNYRRSLPRYRMALGAKAGGAKFHAKTRSEILMQALSPAALGYIEEHGSAEAREIRQAVSQAVTPALLRKLGSAYKAKLTPVVRKSISDTVIQYLEMGTWIVNGDIRRVYRGSDMHYSGWQRSSLTTPDEMFSQLLSPGTDASPAGCTPTQDNVPSWVRHIEGESMDERKKVDCTPQESLELLIDHICALYPGHRDEIVKML